MKKIVLFIIVLNSIFCGLLFSTDDISGKNWQQATASAEFSKRKAHASVVFKDKMWVIAGFTQKGKKIFNDVWYSVDGKTWTCAAINAEFSPRIKPVLLVFKEKLWIIGGFSFNNNKSELFNDVWCSEDGVSWKCITKKTAFNKQMLYDGVVFKGKMWIIGGTVPDDIKNPKTDISAVWSSGDGKKWIKECDLKEFGWTIHSHKCIVYQDNIWILWGYHPMNPRLLIWKSPDGKKWENVKSDQDFLQNTEGNPKDRGGHQTLVYKNYMWRIAGDNSNDCYNDVLKSVNGDKWQIVSNISQFPKRANHTALIYKDKMWVIAGVTSMMDELNDVWWSE
jgi:leucine-zipper-like transcriptional regulator 1